MVWDVDRPEVPVLEVAVPDESVAALSPDGRRVFTATDGPGALRVYDVASGDLLRSTRTEGASDLAVSPDGSTLAVGSGDQVLLFDTTNLTHAGPVIPGHDEASVEYSHDGSMLLAVHSGWCDGLGRDDRRRVAAVCGRWGSGL